MASETAAAAEGEGLHTETGAEGGADHGADPFPPFDSTTFASQLLWLAITFVALYFLMARVALPRIAGILETRRDRIASDLDAAQRLKTESEEAIATYESALGEARGNASSMAEEARDKARQAADARREEVEASLAAKLERAEERIGDIKAEALREVGTISADAAASIVARLTKLEASPGEVETAVADALRERQDNAV